MRLRVFRHSVGLIAAGIPLVAGCDGQFAKPAPSFYYEVRNKNNDKSHVSGLDDGTSLNLAQNRLFIREGRIIADGRDFGVFKAEDHILLDGEGRLFVNDVERQAVR